MARFASVAATAACTCLWMGPAAPLIRITHVGEYQMWLTLRKVVCETGR